MMSVGQRKNIFLDRISYICKFARDGQNTIRKVVLESYFLVQKKLKPLYSLVGKRTKMMIELQIGDFCINMLN